MFNPFEPNWQGNPQNPDGQGQVSDAEKILTGLLAELPEKAQKLVDKVQRDIAKIQEQAETEASELRQRVEKQIAELESKADGRRQALFNHAIEQLEPLQKELFRSGDLGGALATFVQIQALKTKAENVLPDPGNLLQYAQIGKSLRFRVVGTSQGPLWGTDQYTADSLLAVAAVHAGALEDGEEGVVKVTILDLTGVPIIGAFRNGVSSMDWGPYRVGYRVARG